MILNTVVPNTMSLNTEVLIINNYPYYSSPQHSVTENRSLDTMSLNPEVLFRDLIKKMITNAI